MTDGLADMDIGDENSSPETQRTKGLKYMSQLVRVEHEPVCLVCLTRVQQRIANRDQQMLVIDLEDIVKVRQWFPDRLSESYD